MVFNLAAVVAVVLMGVKVSGDACGNGSVVEFFDRDEIVCAMEVSCALQNVDQLEIWLYWKSSEVHCLVKQL